MNIQPRIITIISFIANIPTTQICSTTSIKDDLNLDSIDFMLLIVNLEKRFNVLLSSEEVESIETVKDASDYIGKYLAAA